MTTIRSWLLAAGLLVAAFACAAPVQQRSVYRSYRATRLPPALIYEVATVQPYTGAVWIPGYWDWDGFDWVWIPGHWEVAPAGYVWIGPSYSPFGGYCDYTPGTWRRAGTVERQEQQPRPAPAPVPNRGVARTADRPVAPKPQPIAPRVQEQPTYTAKPPPARLQPAPATRPDLEPRMRETPPPRQVNVQPSRVVPPSQQQTPPVVKPAPKPNNNTTSQAPLKSGSKPSKK